jgi:hypothetical protein
VVFAPPLPRPPTAAFVGGEPVPILEGGRVALRALPADVALRY